MAEINSELKVGVDKPSNHLIYWSALGSIALSLFLVRKNPTLANFTGLWAPTILGLGIYFKENKLLDIEKNRDKKLFAGT